MIFTTKRYKKGAKKNDEMTFESFIAKMGSQAKEEGERELGMANVSAASKSSAYGRRAETLAERGLIGGGFEEHLKLELAGSTEHAKAQKDEARLIGAAIDKKGYASYLSDYEKMQDRIAEAVISKVSSDTSVDVNDAYRMAIGAGLNETNALQTASRAVKAAQENAVEYVKRLAVKYALSAGMTVELGAKYGIKGRYLSTLYKDVARLSTEDEAYFASMSADDVLKYFQNLNG